MDHRPVPSRTYVDVAHVLGAQEARPALHEHAHALPVGVTIAVPLACACDGHLWAQGGDLPWVKRHLRAMMPDLEQVDVSHVPRCDAGTRLVTLRVASQQRRQPPAIPLEGEQQLDRVGVHGPRYWHARPYHGKPHASHTERVPVGELRWRLPRELPAGLGQLLGKLWRDAFGHDNAVAPHRTHEVGNAAIVIVMEVRHEDRIEMQHMCPGQRIDDRIPGAGVHEQGMPSILHENRVSLPDVEHDEARRGHPAP